MNNLSWAARIHSEACGALCYMALNGMVYFKMNESDTWVWQSYSAESLEHRIVKQGGIAAVIQGMKRFVSNANAQERSCQVLLVLSQFERNHKKLVKNGAIGRVLGSLKRNMLITRIQEDGIGFILNLSLKGIDMILMSNLPSHLLIWAFSCNSSQDWESNCEQRRAPAGLEEYGIISFKPHNTGARLWDSRYPLSNE